MIPSYLGPSLAEPPLRCYISPRYDADVLRWSYVRERREALGLSQRALVADMCASYHVGLRYYVGLENGESPGRNVRVGLAVALARSLQVPLSQIVEDHATTPPRR